MGNIQWMGPYEDLKENETKFEKLCVMSLERDKATLKKFSTTTPEKAFLYTFITNPRGILFPIGDTIWGYNNFQYLAWWQRASNALYESCAEKLKSILPIIPIKDAAKDGIYGLGGLAEQLPGNHPIGTPFHDYPFGEFEKRDFGGWKWFGLVTDIDKWDGSYDLEAMPKMGKKEEIVHKAKPKYYESFQIQGKGLVKMKKADPLFASPKGVETVKRRYSFPDISKPSLQNKSTQRYEFISKTIMEKLNTQWTIAIWNGIDLGFASQKKTSSLMIKPEITISIGKFSDLPDGKKAWNKELSHLSKHWENVYRIKVGLPPKGLMNLVTHFKNEESPIWDGSHEKLLDLMKGPIEKLLELAGKKLGELFI